MAAIAERSQSELTQVATPDSDRAGDSTPAKSRDTDTVGSILGFAIWILILGGVGVSLIWHTDASVMLDVSKDRPFVASGTVLFKGQPTDGTVHVTIVDAKTKRYLSGVVVPVNKGQFTTANRNVFIPDAASKEPLRVTAEYQGTSGDKAISGSAIAYIDFAPPLGTRTLAVTSGVSIALIAILTVLFTGELTRRKARLLFAVTYLMTFLSLAVPILLTMMVSQSTYLVEIMQDAPIGLVKGTARGVSDPQWLLNIGGAVQAPRVAPEGVSKPVGAPPTPPPAKQAPVVLASASPTAVDPASQPHETMPAATVRESNVMGLAAPKQGTNASVDADAAGIESARVVGGLAVPF